MGNIYIELLNESQKETIDYMLQISKKDAMIRALKIELKNPKPKKRTKIEANVEDLTLLENQLYKQIAKNKQLEGKLNAAKEEIEKLSLPVPEEPKPSNRKEIAEIEKRHRRIL